MTNTLSTDLANDSLDLLKQWAIASEQWWVDLPAAAGSTAGSSSDDASAPIGFYGTGYNHWGVQTNQKYLAAMAMLGQRTGDKHATSRALAALRFSMRSHIGAKDQPDAVTCMDNDRWGCTWISALGIERMMFAVHALEPHLTESDRAALERMLTAEAHWQHDHHQRGKYQGVSGGKWNHSGQNNPESNIWTGALLWRTAVMYPQHPKAHQWRDKAESFLFNGVSTEADAGHPRYVGPNFFPNYALDHHGYLNVGYMVICTSNAAFLHFDLKQKNLLRPEYLDHHQADLWNVIRAMLFDDGRLARIGGDSRLRYTYCQEYLLPSLLYAVDRFGDDHAMTLAANQIDLIQKEFDHAGDGSFYGRRLAHLAKASPYYYTRLEADRACALASVIAYESLVKVNDNASDNANSDEPKKDTSPLKIITSWDEPEHGAALHRGKDRLASFAWRAHGYTQGLCLPPDRSDMADWSCNLAGRVRFIGDSGPVQGGQSSHRKIIGHDVQMFQGGFVTTGSITEGMNLIIPEGLKLENLATHHLCFAALPDGHSVVGLQLVRMNDKRAHTCELKGMHLNMPNDLYNNLSRTYETEHGKQIIQSPARRDELVELNSRWACIDDTIGVVGLYGADSLSLDRSAQRRGGYYSSLHVDELCWFADNNARAYNPNQTILDVGWRVMSNVNSELTSKLAQADQFEVTPTDKADNSMKRSVTVMGCDDVRYRVSVDFDTQAATVEKA